MTENYTFEFNIFHIIVDNFKQKLSNNIINLVKGARLGRQICFNSYGNMIFNDWDEAYRYPTVSYIDEFNRSKTNCLIFNVIDNKYKNKYDKIFIYHNIRANNNINYGIILYNTITGDTRQRMIFDSDDYAEIIINITKIFGAIDNEPIYSYYVEKSFAIDDIINGNERKKTIDNINFYKNLKLSKYKDLGLNIKVA